MLAPSVIKTLPCLARGFVALNDEGAGFIIECSPENPREKTIRSVFDPNDIRVFREGELLTNFEPSYVGDIRSCISANSVSLICDTRNAKTQIIRLIVGKPFASEQLGEFPEKTLVRLLTPTPNGGALVESLNEGKRSISILGAGPRKEWSSDRYVEFVAWAQNDPMLFSSDAQGLWTLKANLGASDWSGLEAKDWTLIWPSTLADGGVDHSRNRR